MSTILQKNLAKNIVRNSIQEKPLNKKELVVLSGYSQISAESSAHIILEEKGVKQELKTLGFSEDKAKKVVSEIMNNPKVEPNTRLKATDQVFKVQGSYAPEKLDTRTLNIEMKVDNKELLKLDKEYEEKVRKLLLDGKRNINNQMASKVSGKE
jgi:hypothetical protein